MVGEKRSKIQIRWHSINVIERFSSVLYPLDIRELLKQMPTIGYVVPDLVLRGTPEPNKPIATKGDIELVLNQDNKTLGVKGRDTQKTVELFRELRKFYLEKLDPSPGLITHYLELNAEGWARSESNPTEVCSRFWAQYAPLQSLSKLLEAEVTNWGLQLAPPQKDPNDPNWFHIYIEPLIPSSDKRYHIRWIWRGPDLEQLLEKFERIDETLQNLISWLEGH